MSIQSFDPRAHLAAATVSFVPASEVVSQLLISKWPREARALLTALTLEIGPVWTRSWSPFLCLYGFVEWTGSLATFPGWTGATGPTGLSTSAAGPWQDERETDAEMTALTGDPGWEPQDQINKNWLLAVRDYGSRTSGDLLTDLQAGKLSQVQVALVGTWPAGADIGMGGRYAASLALFPVDQPAPPPPPPPPPTPTPSPVSQLPDILVGNECRLTITAATDDTGAPVATLPSDLLKPDDPTICSANIQAMTLAIDGLAVGSTILRGADQVIAVNVVARPVAHLTIDFASAVSAPIAVASKSVVARIRVPMMAMVTAFMLAVTSTGVTETISVPAQSLHFATRDVAPAFGTMAFCVQPQQPLIAIERCLKWTAALLHP